MWIETDRLVLREFAANDWPDVLAYQGDARYLRYYEWEERSEADVRQLVDLFVGWQAESPRRRWQLAIRLRDDQTVVGSAGLRRKDDSEIEADVGYELSPDLWGRGLATEAAAAMVRFGFEELDLHRISSWTIADNAASARVLEKLGMRLEGRLREDKAFKGRRWDTVFYGLLQSEWNTLHRA